MCHRSPKTRLISASSPSLPLCNNTEQSADLCGARGLEVDEHIVQHEGQASVVLTATGRLVVGKAEAEHEEQHLCRAGREIGGRAAPPSRSINSRSRSSGSDSTAVYTPPFATET
jgi:hypothetical protein